MQWTYECLAVFLALLTAVPLAATEPSAVRLGDLRVRDPFILADETTGLYYLCASYPSSESPRGGVAIYTSKDLETWTGPDRVFTMPADFWADQTVWAPEMHAHGGKYYLFVTFTSSDRFPDQWPNWPPRVRRGTQILVADSPRGPFRPFHNGPHTPRDAMALDGTLWVEDGKPYLVYCHEWVQIKDGTVECVRLKDDLSATVGEPVVLFKGSDAPWASKPRPSYVTDGCFLYRAKTGKLLMLWSSFGSNGYATGVAVSQSGKLAGPWTQQPTPLFATDGGHAMIFRRFDGALMLALHQPNQHPNERARLFELEDTGDTVRIKEKRSD